MTMFYFLLYMIPLSAASPYLFAPLTLIGILIWMFS